MVDRAERLISEIKQIKTQYTREVGQGRRAWPKAIKERIAELDQLGIAAKTVAAQTGISYETLMFWRYKRRKDGDGFHGLVVNTSSPEPKLPALAPNLANAVTVTVPNFAIPMRSNVVSETLTLKTPNGFVVGGLTEAGVLSILARLTPGGGHAT